MENYLLENISKSIINKNKKETFFYYLLIKKNKLKILENNFWNKIYFLDEKQKELIKKSFLKLKKSNINGWKKLKIIIFILILWFFIFIYRIKKKYIK